MQNTEDEEKVVSGGEEVGIRFKRDQSYNVAIGWICKSGKSADFVAGLFSQFPVAL